MSGKRSTSFSGDAVREHNETEAKRLIDVGLARMKLDGCALESMRKGAPEKMALVWLLKKQTVMKNEWISRHLCCGHPANIPGYVRKVENAEGDRILELKKILISED